MLRNTGKIIGLVIVFLFVSNAQKKDLTLDEIFTNRALYGKNMPGIQWYDGGKKFSFLKMNPQTRSMDLYSHDCETGKEEILVSSDKLKIEGEDKPVALTNYEWSPDEKYIMMTGVLEARSIKTGGTFYLFNIAEGKITHIIESGEEQVNVSFSPDSKKLAFVRSNDLFVYNLETRKETRLTFDGSKNVLNGIFDWVYEEEFSIIRGYEWSPDSKTIAFWRLDQTNVPEIRLAKYDSLYLNTLDMKYPKAGGNNSLVQIGMVNVETSATVWADIGAETDIYIPRINFTADPQILSVQRLDRLQQKFDLLFVSVSTGKSTVVYKEQDTCWIDITDDLHFLSGKKQFLLTSETSGYRHIYLFDYSGNKIAQLTNGSWEVGEIKGVDEKRGLIYYTSNERGVRYSDLYTLTLDGKKKTLLTESAGFHRINLSKNFTHYIDAYSTANTFTVSTLYSADGKKIRDLTAPDMSVFSTYNISPVEFFTFTTSDGVTINGSMIKPTNFDPSKKYPVLIYNYSGPGSQLVQDSWGGFNYWWHLMLAQKGYIIVSIDNRGTGGRGKEFKQKVYKNLGYWESFDHIEAAKYLSAQPYVDGSRIGIWGWSYGGYMSAYTLMAGAEYFKAAISVAPVTHWKFYDTIYTERYMSLPELNPDGYEKSSVLALVPRMKGKLLLVHGTADDNVHFQNAVKLAERLIAENKPFQTMFYPEKNHGIYGGKTRQHLYEMMTDFILKNL